MDISKITPRKEPKLTDAWWHCCKDCANTLPMHTSAVGGILYPDQRCEVCGGALTLDNFHPLQPQVVKMAQEIREQKLRDWYETWQRTDPSYQRTQRPSRRDVLP